MLINPQPALLLFLRRHPFPFVLLCGLLIWGVINLFFPRSLPADAEERAFLLLDAGWYAEAEMAFEEALDADPLDPTLNYFYISNHFSLYPVEQYPGVEFHAHVNSRYYDLVHTGDATMTDMGWYGRALVFSYREQYEDALEQYLKVENRDLPYLNNSIGYVYNQLGSWEQAEPYLWAEVNQTQGNAAGAVSNLQEAYLLRGDYDGLRRLRDEPAARIWMDPMVLRTLSLRDDRPDEYFRDLLITPLAYINLQSVLAAMLIGVMWYVYFRRIDVFEKESFVWTALTVGMGGVTVLAAMTLGDVLYLLVPMRETGEKLNDFLYYLVHVGLVEESVKLLPLIVVLRWSKQVNEPVDVLIYASLSALGFATLENMLYFSGYGISLAFARFLVSTVMHMALTALVCFGWINARWNGRAPLPGALLTFVMAVGLHAMFDFFLIRPEGIMVAILLVIIGLTVAYRQMLRAALTNSPYYCMLLRETAHRYPLELLLSAAVILLAAGFIENHLLFSTHIANQSMIGEVTGSLILMLVVFGLLSGVSPGILRNREPASAGQ